MAAKELNSAEKNILLEERYVDYEGAANLNVYIFGYNHEGRDQVCYMLESLPRVLSIPQFTVTLVNESMTRSEISDGFCTAIQKIKTNMKTQEDTAIVFVMVMNPNIHSKTKGEKDTVSKLLNEIGPEISVRCVLVLSNGKEMFNDGTTLKHHYNDVVSKKLCMCDLYEKMYPKIIAIDIEDVSENNDIQRKQMLSLLLASGAGFDKPVSHRDKITTAWIMKVITFGSGWVLAVWCICYITFACK
ncbi:hypothetical protein HOLleu_24825 [Holothuria leucospilota]|uniref:Uncharacterized protein n=1 Tax=Holothuria leucospilota TaxID=206669 RepID=A0A9Q1H1G8_HOLLE|nr:hypothetical protein HOLleu_24825 [Holothuria leucospilota]